MISLSKLVSAPRYLTMTFFINYNLLSSVSTYDVAGPIFDALHGDVFGRLPSSDDQNPFSGKLARVSEIVSVHYATGETFLQK